MDTFSKLHNIRMQSRIYLPDYHRPDYVTAAFNLILVSAAIYIALVLALI